MTKVQLNNYENSHYSPGAGIIKRTVWYYINAWLFKSYILPSSVLKIYLLRLFGAKIGHNVTLKPNINIKYPWFLEIGDHTWIGEEVWIDNLTFIRIGSNCCFSQGSMLLTGNHNYSVSNFDLIVKPILIEDGVWIGAKSIVCPGVVCKNHSVLTVASVATKQLEAFTIYQGNPALAIKERIVK